MNVIGLIPARGGSKGFPRKNISMLCGQPLIGYTIKAALGAKSLTRVIVSTDDSEIAGIAREYGAETPFMRPVEYSGDETGAIEVILHAVQEIESTQGIAVDRIAYLQPTSPLRTSQHIDRGMHLFETTGADTVVSVVQVPHQYSPGSTFEVDQNQRIIISHSSYMLRRQDKEKIYARNGPSVLIVSRGTWESGCLYGDRTIAMEMSAEESVDIDSELDLALAECVLRKRAAN